MAVMATRFRLPIFIRVGNAVTRFLLRRGVTMGTNTLLTVPGRKSGVPRTTPITIIEHAGRRYVQSPFGEVDWVRNLRAAGAGTLARGRHAETVTVRELSAEETAPVLEAALQTGAVDDPRLLRCRPRRSARGLRARGPASSLLRAACRVRCC
jgi:deazaflavin-dependent oxidoreductase (nitroreductase family)